jgi:hypothetical protein
MGNLGIGGELMDSLAFGPIFSFENQLFSQPFFAEVFLDKEVFLSGELF